MAASDSASSGCAQLPFGIWDFSHVKSSHTPRDMYNDELPPGMTGEAVSSEATALSASFCFPIVGIPRRHDEVERSDNSSSTSDVKPASANDHTCTFSTDDKADKSCSDKAIVMASCMMVLAAAVGAGMVIAIFLAGEGVKRTPPTTTLALAPTPSPHAPRAVSGAPSPALPLSASPNSHASTASPTRPSEVTFLVGNPAVSDALASSTVAPQTRQPTARPTAAPQFSCSCAARGTQQPVTPKPTPSSAGTPTRQPTTTTPRPGLLATSSTSPYESGAGLPDCVALADACSGCQHHLLFCGMTPTTAMPSATPHDSAEPTGPPPSRDVRCRSDSGECIFRRVTIEDEALVDEPSE